MTPRRPEVEFPRHQQDSSGAAATAEPWSAATEHSAALESSGRPPLRSASAPLHAISPVRKAAIVLVSLDQSLASQLLSHLDRSAVEAVTWEIARLGRIELAERTAVLEEFYGLGLRRLCFVFDDLGKMSDSDIRTAFHDEDSATWALALAGAAAAVRARVLAALSSMTADRLSAQLDHLGPFRLSDSEAAQQEITERLRRLYDHGKISLPEPTGRDEVLV
jgi:flagellar motor switch protein FliG